MAETTGEHVQQTGVVISETTWKFILGVLQAIILTALFATIAWAWNQEGRMAMAETRISVVPALEAKIDAQEKVLQAYAISHAKYDSDISYIKTGIGEIKQAISELD